MQYKLGRIPDPFDARTLEHPVSAVLPTKPLRSQQWESRLTLDQGPVPACTGFSAATNLASFPIPESNVTNDIGYEIYNRAQRLDPWSHTPHEGSTITAAMKACMELFPGVFDSYKWARSSHDVALALGYLGPVIMGTDWLNSMFIPDAEHVVHVKPESGAAGGHAYMLCGVNVEKQRFTIKNSWGMHWGINGKAYIGFDDLSYLLLHPSGQCLVPLGKQPRPIS